MFKVEGRTMVEEEEETTGIIYLGTATHNLKDLYPRTAPLLKEIPQI
jgi:hypothetical protein